MMMEYAPLPTWDQLSALAAQLASGGSLTHLYRIEGGLGCTTDVIELTETNRDPLRLVLRRYGPWWQDTAGDPAQREFAALEAALANGVPVPEPIWMDPGDLFEDRAVVISFVEGKPLLDPADPMDWARQLAQTLVAIHATPLPDALQTNLRDLDAEEREAIDHEKAPDRFAEHPLGPALWDHRRDLLSLDPTRRAHSLRKPATSFPIGHHHGG